MYDAFNDFFLQLLMGAWVTVQLALCSLVLGLGIGLLAAVAENSHTSALRWFATSMISLVRGLPELVVIFLVYFGGTVLLGIFFDQYINVSPFVAGTLALSLLFGSYASQTFRAAFQMIPIGQTEAGKALGLNRAQIFFHIQFPQAWRHALPGLSNLWLTLLKDTALVSLIGLHDLMNNAQAASRSTYQPFTFYLAAAVLYLLMTSISQLALQQINSKASKHLSI